MKKMLISEDEKSRILNLHQNLGYKTSLNEQSVPQSVPQKPQPNVQKPTESLDSYFTIDPTGKKIASISPSFVKWTTTNNINPYAAKFEVKPNNQDLYAVGTDGKTYGLNLLYFNASKGNIPQDAKEKASAARQSVREKIKELDAKGAAALKCFDVNGVRKNDIKNGETYKNCKIYFNEFDVLVSETELRELEMASTILNFASVALKFKPKQG